MTGADVAGGRVFQSYAFSDGSFVPHRLLTGYLRVSLALVAMAARAGGSCAVWFAGGERGHHDRAAHERLPLSEHLYTCPVLRVELQFNALIDEAGAQVVADPVRTWEYSVTAVQERYSDSDALNNALFRVALVTEGRDPAAGPVAVGVGGLRELLFLLDGAYR